MDLWNFYWNLYDIYWNLWNLCEFVRNLLELIQYIWTELVFKNDSSSSASEASDFDGEVGD